MLRRARLVLTLGALLGVTAISAQTEPTGPAPESVGSILCGEAGPPQLDSLLARARRYLGTRYRARVEGRTFDCSGYARHVFAPFGFTLSASSRAQAAHDGRPVPDDSLRPGDLVFFSGRRRSPVTGHVGIVTEVAGPGRFLFIHASVRAGVVVSHSTEPYYRARYLGARRVLPDPQRVLRRTAPRPIAPEPRFPTLLHGERPAPYPVPPPRRKRSRR